MTIHFVCTGNIYRSRLAEAYWASRCVPGLRVSSSGIGTILNRGVTIAPYAARMVEEHGLERFVAPTFRQTTPELVRASDVLVFMEREHHRVCEGWIDHSQQTVEVWEIADVGPVDVACMMTTVRRTFALIAQKTDTLLITLGASASLQQGNAWSY